MPWSYVQQDDGADCVAQEDHSTAHVANSASPILPTAPRQSTMLFG